MDSGNLAEALLPDYIAGERREKSLYDIIDVYQTHHHFGIVDCDGKVSCDVVTESRNRTVVVGPAPLAEYIGKAVDVYMSPCLISIGEEQVLPCFLGCPRLPEWRR
jgi:hypothetical protein